MRLILSPNGYFKEPRGGARYQVNIFAHLRSGGNNCDPFLYSTVSKWPLPYLPIQPSSHAVNTQLLKKIRDTKGNFHAKMGTIKDRNSEDLTGEEIKKKWQEYTELYKKDLHDPDNHNGVITHTHLEPDISNVKLSGP